MAIKVVALEAGHYGTYRWPGDEFEIDTAPNQYTWYKPVDEVADVEIEKPAKRRRASSSSDDVSAAADVFGV